MLFDREVDLDLFLFLTSSIILHLDVVVVILYGLYLTRIISDGI